MNKIITLGDIFRNLETDEKAFKFLGYIKDMQIEIEKLTAESTKWESKFYDEAKKVDKAIEYMKDNSKISLDDCVSIINFYRELLSILKGVDKEWN